ncbi:hypothetical protein O6H91_13G049900 [Diphasiastrum complanatum]|uniref:Uncharacterized protein n=1 Tax=Diphasiastrum complanatum TaxID=34168 RepID=A0ACC2BUM4_DIPCM|nr:hypothetical protein O6H91_13G049900 [Diphasiastrum complanatum]
MVKLPGFGLVLTVVFGRFSHFLWKFYVVLAVTDDMLQLFGEGVLSPVRSVGSPDNGPQSILDVIGKVLLEIHQSNKQRDEQIKFLLSKHDAASASHLDFQPEVFTTDKKLSSQQQWSHGLISETIILVCMEYLRKSEFLLYSFFWKVKSCCGGET